MLLRLGGVGGDLLGADPYAIGDVARFAWLGKGRIGVDDDLPEFLRELAVGGADGVLQGNEEGAGLEEALAGGREGGPVALHEVIDLRVEGRAQEAGDGGSRLRAAPRP